MSSQPSIRDAVEFRREAYGLTRRDWATVLGMQQSHYSEFVTGKRDLPKNAMANAFEYGVPACVLFQCRPNKGIEHIHAAIAKATSQAAEPAAIPPEAAAVGALHDGASLEQGEAL